MPAPQITTSAVGALIRAPPRADARIARVAHDARNVRDDDGVTTRLLGRQDRQLARRAKRDGVGTVFPAPGRDPFAVQGPDPTPLGLLGIVAQLPESRPELPLERRGRPFPRAALPYLPFPVQYRSLRV